MKKHNLFFLAGLLVLGIMPIIGKGQWTVVDTAGFSSGSIVAPSIAVDGNGIPYAVFRDAGYSNKVVVMKHNGTNWVTLGTAGLSVGSTTYTSLAIDSKDSVYVAFSDDGNSSKTTVMKYSGSSWVTVDTAGFSAGAASYLSLAIDSKDSLYLAYRDVANSNKATVMKYNGSSWVALGGAGFSPGGATFTSLGIDSKDSLYIAFADNSNSNKATVMKYNGSTWSLAGTPFSAGSASNTTLAIDSNDSVYVAYQDGFSSSKATVMKYNGSSWSAVGTAAFSAGQSFGIILKIDGSNNPFVAYADGGNRYSTTVMSYNGSSWSVVGTAGFVPGSFVLTFSFTLSDDDKPYILYSDPNKSGKATVQYFDYPNTWNGTTWSLGTPDSTQNAIIASGTAPTSFSCNNLTINSGFSLNTGTSDVVTIYGNVTNNGDGVTGTGTLTFTKNGTSTLSGDTIEHEGTIIVESGCTLATNGLLRLESNATNTGHIGESYGTISGNVYVQRYMPGKRCFRFYGHPFSTSIALSQLTDEIDITGNGGAANGFTATITNNPSAFYWDVSTADNSTTGANPGWQPFTSANTTSWDRYELLRLLVRGAKGQGLSNGTYTPVASTFEAAGEVNQGTQVITLTKGSNSDFVACGNPFPSPVQMNTVALGSNVGANYYAWDATSGAAGAYVTNAWTLDWKLPAYAAFFTTLSANSNNTLTFEEQDKEAIGTGLFKTTGPDDWVELYIYDSATKWDRLLIHLDDNAMEVEDNQDGKKLYNPGLDFFTLSKDDVRLAVDVRPYNDGAAIPLGLTAYNRYNRYVIKTGMFNIPAGTRLYLHDKYLNKKEELKGGFEYWFDVTNDSLTQGNNRFEINMVGQPANGIANTAQPAKMQIVPNPAREEVKLSFDKLEGTALVRITGITGQVIFSREVNTATGSITIPLGDIPAGVYIAELKSKNASLTEKLIVE